MWRQTIENITFSHKNTSIRITVSGALAVITSENNYPEALEHLENIIKEAKQIDTTNCIYFDNGTKTVPVESYIMSVPEMKIVIDE